MWELLDQDTNECFRKSESLNRTKLVDSFIGDTIETIFNLYQHSVCSTIFFDLWELTYLSIFDSPDGSILNRKENIHLKLINPPFSVQWEKVIHDVYNKDGIYSEKAEIVARHIESLTWNSVQTSLVSGTGKFQLDKGKHNPQLISLYESSPYSAHDLITGNRVQLTGHPIDPESLKKCDCIFCNQNDPKRAHKVQSKL